MSVWFARMYEAKAGKKARLRLRSTLIRVLRKVSINMDFAY